MQRRDKISKKRNQQHHRHIKTPNSCKTIGEVYADPLYQVVTIYVQKEGDLAKVKISIRDGVYRVFINAELFYEARIIS